MNKIDESYESGVESKGHVDIRNWWVVYREGDEAIFGIFPREELAVGFHRDRVARAPADGWEIGRIRG